ncbi:hypothetical protein SynBIOSU31_02316 [Synechococcus sp. BIOS-U3-1]|uniref:DUF1824 family protein n=1 Tax=Synechococcus sp. BIOS-U3-1 TaxID=1400865 RepID=UPI0016481E8D|nr:DUF1824 family protein [Synechococcus sp. BIOS-U3-1]QNI59182.1 hypothetical protein SynBIOSU31_02316 [Synechococcus sp. BIOS-U3-1]|tara:strand:- start:23 stop:409 length:387 start_codon:yes stop_codon:yes gene_type:complete
MRLSDLNRLRTAPVLNSTDKALLIPELQQQMTLYSWFTAGIMALTADQAVQSLRQLEQHQAWDAHDLMSDSELDGPVYLKANQKTLTARLRIEHGLGEGILISGHGNDNTEPSATWGPLPLDFFAFTP